jgi:hypothetical protein
MVYLGTGNTYCLIIDRWDGSDCSLLTTSIGMDSLSLHWYQHYPLVSYDVLISLYLLSSIDSS